MKVFVADKLPDWCAKRIEGMGAYVLWVPDRHIVVVRYVPRRRRRPKPPRRRYLKPPWRRHR